MASKSEIKSLCWFAIGIGVLLILIGTTRTDLHIVAGTLITFMGFVLLMIAMLKLSELRDHDENTRPSVYNLLDETLIYPSSKEGMSFYVASAELNASLKTALNVQLSDFAPPAGEGKLMKYSHDSEPYRLSERLSEAIRAYAVKEGLSDSQVLQELILEINAR